MLKKLVVVLVVLAVVAGYLLARDWDSPELGRRLLAEVGKATGVRIEAEGFRLNLLEGLVLENVDAKSASDGRELAFTLDRLVFEHRLLPLLSGTVAVDRIVLESPHFDLVRTEAKGTGAPPVEPAPERAGEAGGGGLALEIDRILVRDGSLSIRNEAGEEKTRVEGLDLEMENVRFDGGASSLAGLAAEGALEIDSVRFDALELTATEGGFQLADARFVVPELRFATPHGRFVAESSVDFNPVPFTYELKAVGDPLDLNGLVGAAEGSEGFGPATLELEARGAGPETEDLDASGEVALGPGRFPETELFTRIDSALGKNALVGSPYQATRTSFRLSHNHVTLAPFRFESGDVLIDLAGSLSLEGPIDLDLAVATPREGLDVEGVSADVLDVLADDQGWVPVPLDVTGSFESPRVLPDAKALVAQAGKGAKRAVTEALKGLLKKKKNE